MIFRIVFYSIFLPAVFLVALSLWGFWQVTHPTKTTSELTPFDLDWQFQQVTLTTRDNLSLDSWFVPSTRKTDKAVILLHDYGSEKSELLYTAAFLRRTYNLFFLDFRYFGNSQGNHTSLGFDEREDVQAAITYLKARGMSSIGLLGFSYGGSIALLMPPESKEIKAVVASAPIANLDLMSGVYFRKIPFLTDILVRFTRYWALLLYSIDEGKITPEIAVKKTQTPTFIIASLQDEVILVENARRLEKDLRNNKSAQVLIYDREVHEPLEADPFESQILKFFAKNL